MQNYSPSNNTYKLKQELSELFKDDPLFIEIKNNTLLLDHLFSQDFLSSLPTKGLYSTPHISTILNVPDAQIRYYIKPFELYIGVENISGQKKIYRFNYISIFKVKMILLLKDSKRVSGIKKLLFNDFEEGPKTLTSNMETKTNQNSHLNEDINKELLTELIKLNQEVESLKKLIIKCSSEILMLKEESILTNEKRALILQELLDLGIEKK